MRKNILEALLPGARRRILQALLAEPSREWYHSDLAHHLGATASSLQKELRILTEAGVLSDRRDGNRVYYKANESCVIFPELRSIFSKVKP